MASPPGAVLFVCNLNRVRSPMAAALARRRWGTRTFVDSCGLRVSGELDPFVAAAMQEVGLDLTRHQPKSFETLGDGSFDWIISLTPEAHARATELSRGRAVELRHWPTPDPTAADGSRAQRLDLYRQVRDGLDRRLGELFADPAEAGG